MSTRVPTWETMENVSRFARLCEAYFQEVGLAQILVDHVN